MTWQDRTHDLKTEFDEHGYIIIREFLSDARALDVLNNVERYIAEVIPNMPHEQVYYEVPGEKDTLKQIQQMHTYDAYFEDLFLHSPLKQLAETLLDDEVNPTNMQYFNKPPGVSQPTPIHQDGYYFHIKPKSALTIWLALDSVDEENGCIRYVKGAHRHGVRNHARTNTLGFSQGISDYSDEDRAAEIPIHASPGDLIAHHCLMVHRADANSSTRPRRALGFIYYAAQVEEDLEQKAAYQAKLIADLKQQGKI